MKSPQPSVWSVLVALWLAGCDPKTTVGSSCPKSGCPKLVSCETAKQQLPLDCDEDDAGVRTCNGAVVPNDRAACSACRQSLVTLRAGDTPIASCTCAHCAAQVAACFESATREPDGNADRDIACRKIVECGWGAQCEGSECFCGKGVSEQDCATAANRGIAPGLCADVIIAGTSCSRSGPIPLGACIEGERSRKGTALYLANEVARCGTGDPFFPHDPMRPTCPIEQFIDR